MCMLPCPSFPNPSPRQSSKPLVWHRIHYADPLRLSVTTCPKLETKWKSLCSQYASSGECALASPWFCLTYILLPYFAGRNSTKPLQLSCCVVFFMLYPNELNCSILYFIFISFSCDLFYKPDSVLFKNKGHVSLIFYY